MTTGTTVRATRAAMTLAAAITMLPGCHDEGKAAPTPEASAPALTPMGMASAATLVPTTNAVVVLATLHHPKEAVVAQDALVVTDRATESDDATDIVSVPVAAPGAPRTLYPGQRGAEGLAFAGGRLVFITVPSADGKDHSKILSARIGSSPAPVVRTYDLDETLTVSDGTDVFSFGDVKTGKTASPDVLRIGGNGKAATVATTGDKLVRTALAVNATHVFWAQGGSIVRAPKGGGEPAVVIKLPAGKIQRLAADDAAVYWTDSGTGDPQWSGRVYRASLDGKVETLSDAPSPFAIAVDADSVYWTSSTDTGGRILSRKKSGGATFVLASDQHGPRSVAVDDRSVYWIDKGDGNVCRTDKAPHAGP
jgi:hypothetical protein